MSADREVLELECQLRLIEHAAAQHPEVKVEPLDLWIDGFWAGVRAQAKPRSAASLQLAIDAHRQEHSPAAPKRPRRKPNFGGIE